MCMCACMCVSVDSKVRCFTPDSLNLVTVPLGVQIQSKSSASSRKGNYLCQQDETDLYNKPTILLVFKLTYVSSPYTDP